LRNAVQKVPRNQTIWEIQHKDLQEESFENQFHPYAKV